MQHAAQPVRAGEHLNGECLFLLLPRTGVLSRAQSGLLRLSPQGAVRSSAR